MKPTLIVALLTLALLVAGCTTQTDESSGDGGGAGDSVEGEITVTPSPEDRGNATSEGNETGSGNMTAPTGSMGNSTGSP